MELILIKLNQYLHFLKDCILPIHAGIAGKTSAFKLMTRFDSATRSTNVN